MKKQNQDHDKLIALATVSRLLNDALRELVELKDTKASCDKYILVSVNVADQKIAPGFCAGKLKRGYYMAAKPLQAEVFDRFEDAERASWDVAHIKTRILSQKRVHDLRVHDLRETIIPELEHMVRAHASQL